MEKSLFGLYCYGPVDLLQVKKDSNSMQLLLRTVEGGFARADYTGCVYWRLGARQIGMHLPLVQQLSAEELLARSNSDTLVSLRKNTDDVASLLRDWERRGLKFYLHFGTAPGSEYLVAAEAMHYKETI